MCRMDDSFLSKKSYLSKNFRGTEGTPGRYAEEAAQSFHNIKGEEDPGRCAAMYTQLAARLGDA